MTDPHFHDDRIIEREVVVGTGNNPLALLLAGALVVFIVVLVAVYLL